MSRGPLDLTYKIFNLVDTLQINLAVHYIPGTYDVEADRLSRLRTIPEWHLLPRATNIIFAKWGTPVIDIFASQMTRVVPKYCTLDCQDSQAEFHDALSQVWNYSLAWVFPPPFLMPKVLQHLNKCRGTFLIVALRWEQVFWRPALKNCATASPWTIENLPRVLVDVATGLPPQRVSEITLEVWRCRGGVSI